MDPSAAEEADEPDGHPAVQEAAAGKTERQIRFIRSGELQNPVRKRAGDSLVEIRGCLGNSIRIMRGVSEHRHQGKKGKRAVRQDFPEFSEFTRRLPLSRGFEPHGGCRFIMLREAESEKRGRRVKPPAHGGGDTGEPGVGNDLPDHA